MRIAALIIGSAAILAASVPARAQTPDQDVRCLLASNFFAKADKDPERRQVASLSVFYYLGRLDGRLSAEQMKTQLVAQAKTLNPSNAGPVMTACAKRVQEKSAALQALGQQAKKPTGK